MAKIFISYRRDDAQWQTRALYNALSRHVDEPASNIFYDLDSMTVGLNFKRQIEDTVQQCDVLLAVIGRDWLTMTDEAGQRRLDDPNDFVRLEIAAAAEATARRDAIRDLQTELKRLGYYNSAIDGVAGIGTQRALDAFASSASISTRRLDTATSADIESLATRASRAQPPPPPFDADAARRRGNTAYHREDYATARQEYESACSGGNMQACTSLGHLYQNALGVTQDYDRTRSLYQQACDGGYEAACGPLETLPD